MKTDWTRNPWRHGSTIWLARGLEERFVEDVRRAGLILNQIAPCVLNNLRWAWRRSLLNHHDPEGWTRAVAHAKAKQGRIGPVPDDYNYAPPARTPPTDQRIKAVFRAATAFEPACKNPVLDKTTKAVLRRQQHATAAPLTPAGFDPQAFLSRHWLEVFAPLWRAYRLSGEDQEGETGRVLAIAYKNKLDEQSANPDGRVGPAARAWDQLLRALCDGVRPGPPLRVPPRVMPPIKLPSTGAAGTSPEIYALFKKVLAQD
jgi:hypothetical protein